MAFYIGPLQLSFWVGFRVKISHKKALFNAVCFDISKNDDDKVS